MSLYQLGPILSSTLWSQRCKCIKNRFVLGFFCFVCTGEMPDNTEIVIVWLKKKCSGLEIGIEMLTLPLQEKVYASMVYENVLCKYVAVVDVWRYFILFVLTIKHSSCIFIVTILSKIVSVQLYLYFMIHTSAGPAVSEGLLSLSGVLQ